MSRYSSQSVLRIVLALVVFLIGYSAAVPTLTNVTSSALTSSTTSTSAVAVSNLNGSAIYSPLFAQHSLDTPRFINVSQQTVNPLVRAALGLTKLSRRDASALPEGACAPGTPCVNGACCSNVD